jgi:hypothetical protein
MLLAISQLPVKAVTPTERPVVDGDATAVPEGAPTAPGVYLPEFMISCHEDRAETGTNLGAVAELP